MSGNSDEKKFSAIMIIEVLGRPKEHLIQTLEDLSKEISEEKGVKLLSKKINEPNLAKDQKDLFTSFAEIEIEVDKPMMIAALMFKYMPSHIEIIEPEKFIFTNAEYSEIMNELTRRLHRYEELVKVMQMQMQSGIVLPKIEQFKEKLEGSKKPEKKKAKKGKPKKKS